MPSSLGVKQAGLEEVQLSPSVTIRRYRQMESNKDRIGLADFIERLLERYISMEVVPLKTKEWFCDDGVRMSIDRDPSSSIEGRPSTHESINSSQIDNPCKPTNPKKTRTSKSELAFCYFFNREPSFAPFRSHATDFYKCVRCGILHQGETGGGWQIHRRGALLDSTTRTVNATAFLRNLHQALAKYADALRASDWNEDIWQLFRTKMNAIIENCKYRRLNRRTHYRRRHSQGSGACTM